MTELILCVHSFLRVNGRLYFYPGIDCVQTTNKLPNKMQHELVDIM